MSFIEKENSVRYYKGLCAAAAVALGAALAMGAPAVGAEASVLPVYAAETATPPIDHVIRRIHVRECTRDPVLAQSSELRATAFADLSRRASAMGANGLTRAEVKTVKSTSNSLPHGVLNPCLYETDAKADAAVLGSASQVSAPN